MKTKIIVLLLLFCGTFSYSQQGDVRMDIPSPQVADFVRLSGAASVAKNTGRLNFSIPLLELSNKDFKIPISLSYNSAGAQPTKNPGIVGYNWSLNVGGVITREIRGVPDDKIPNADYSSSIFSIFGMLSIVRENIDFRQIFRDSTVLENIGAKIITNHIGSFIPLPGNYVSQGGIETTPDVYHFNFCGYSGKFIIGYDGKPKVVSYGSGKFQVDLSDYNYDKARYGDRAVGPDYQESQYDKESVIKITTDDGYEYWFGGTNETLEYSWQLLGGEFPGVGDMISPEVDYGQAAPITAWHLSKIVSPAGDEAIFEYEQYDGHHRLLNIDNFNCFSTTSGGMTTTSKRSCYNFNQQVNQFLKVENDINSVFGLKTSEALMLRQSLTKIARVKRIRLNGHLTQINFHYKDTEGSVFANWVQQSYTSRANFSKCGSKLDSITFTEITAGAYGYGYTKTTKFTYSNDLRLYLKKLKIDNDLYEFEYHNPERLELPGRQIYKKLDHWGFSNGAFGNNLTYERLLSDFEMIYGLPYPYPFEDRPFGSKRRSAADRGYCSAGLLKKVSFPTKGYLEIEYEEHQYGKRLIGAESFGEIINKKPGITGGARVKELIEKDQDDKIAQRRSFSYFKEDGTSSGMLLDVPGYELNFYAVDPNVLSYNDYVIWSKAIASQMTYEHDHVVYSQVKETMVEEVGNSILNGLPTTLSHGEQLEEFGFPAYPTDQWATKEIQVVAKRDAFVSFYYTHHNDPDSGKVTVSFQNSKLNKKFDVFPAYSDNSISEYIYFPKGTTTITIEVPPNTRFFTAYYIFCPREEDTGPYTITHFTDWEDYGLIQTFDAYDGNLRSRRGFLEDHSIQRGKVKKVESYRKDNVLLQKMEYEYAYTDKTTHGYTAQHTNGNIGYAGGKIPLYPFNLVKQTTTDYNYRQNNQQKDSIKTVIDYTYNPYNLLATSKQTDSRNVEIKVEYKYPTDFASTAPYNAMIGKNILNPVIEKTTTVDSTVVLLKEKNEYALFHNKHYLPATHSVSHYNKPYELKKTFNYSPLGNIRSIVGADGSKIVYVWDLYGKFLLAKIENATEDQLKNVNGTNLFDLGQSPWTGVYESFQSRQKDLPKDVLMTIYEHHPFKGITRMTDPKGLEFTYDYDESYRLKEIKDSHKNVIEHHKYQYQQ
jgi:hypothetical protein